MVEQAPAYARTCGFIYVLIFVAGLFGEVVVSGRLVVPGDAAATATNVLASEELWRAGYSAQIVTMVCDVLVAWLLYELLAPVQRNLALLAAFFRLTYVAAYVPATLANVVVPALEHQSLQQAALTVLRFHDAAFAVSLVFFGANLALIGYLIGRQPIGVRWLSLALQIAGACYIVNSFAIFLAPRAQAVMFPWILLPPFIAELGLTFWLLFTRRFSRALAA